MCSLVRRTLRNSSRLTPLSLQFFCILFTQKTSSLSLQFFCILFTQKTFGHSSISSFSLLNSEYSEKLLQADSSLSLQFFCILFTQKTFGHSSISSFSFWQMNTFAWNGWLGALAWSGWALSHGAIACRLICWSVGSSIPLHLVQSEDFWSLKHFFILSDS